MPIGLPFLLGVNYWPRKKAMFMWERFDACEIREDFSLIKSIGLTHVRLFLLWESFQPEPRLISGKALDELRTVANIAAELGLKLEPTFFTGHMSGPNWAPDWLVGNEPLQPNDRWLVSLKRWSSAATRVHNIYTTPFVLEAEELQLRTVCGAMKDHPAIWAWSLGNEPDLFCQPPTDAIGREWMKRMAGIIKEADPNHLTTIGFHTAELDGNVGLRVDHAAEATDFSVMHGYSIYHPIARSPLDPDFVPFCGALTAALAGRPVLFEEFGLCTRVPDQPSGYEDMLIPGKPSHRQWFSSEADAAAYYEAVLPRLQRVGCTGAFAWCFGDYVRELWDRPPCDYVVHERFFGLFRADGTPKPAALAVKKFAKSTPKILVPEWTVRLDMRVSEYYENALKHMEALYKSFGAL